MSRLRVDPILPSGQDASFVAKLRHELEGAGEPVRLLVGNSARELPPLVSRLVMEVLEETSAGRAVSIVPTEAEVTTQEAARILNVSRPFLVGMIDKGILPSRMVGNQRRLPLQAVLDYKADNRAKRKAVLDEMAALDQELGILE